MTSGGPLSSLKVVYDKEDGIYRPGDRLTGRVEISLRETLTLRGIKLQFKGRACWAGDGKKDGEVERVFFNRDMVLFDRPPGQDPGDFVWKTGNHILPFECPLPKNCVTSYEGGQAFVRYFCRATLIRSKGEGARSKEQTFVSKAPFTILGPPPPSVDPTLLKGVGASEHAIVSGCCCSKGRLQGDVTVHKSLFVAGERVFGSVKVDNKTGNPIEALFCRVVEVLRKTATAEQSIRRIVVERRLEESAVNQRGNLSRDNVFLVKIPSVAPSTRPPAPGESSIFNLGYEIEIFISPKLSLQVPIVVGHIPLSLDDGAPTPTGFQEFALGPQDVRESDDPSDLLEGGAFAPKYPVFESGTYIPSSISTHTANSELITEQPHSQGLNSAPSKEESPLREQNGHPDIQVQANGLTPTAELDSHGIASSEIQAVQDLIPEQELDTSGVTVTTKETVTVTSSDGVTTTTERVTTTVENGVEQVTEQLQQTLQDGEVLIKDGEAELIEELRQEAHRETTPV